MVNCRNQIRAFKQVFEENSVDYAVSYASKAFSAIAMYQVVAAEGVQLRPSCLICQTKRFGNFPVQLTSMSWRTKLVY